jgi:anaerobic magnesium-protoporphyrin IX monomethyl ester cyclase
MSCQNIDVFLFQLPNKTIEIPSLGTAILKEVIQKNNFSCTQIDLNVVIKDKFLNVENLLYIMKDVLPYMIEINIGNQKIVHDLEMLLNYVTKIEKEFTLTELYNTKKMIQERKYESVFCDSFRSLLFSKMLTLLSMSSIFLNLIVSNRNIENAFPDLFLFDIIDKIFSEIISKKPFAVGFSIVEMQRQLSVWSIDRLKNELGYNGKVIVGGSDITYFQTSYIKNFVNIDFAIYKEGEISFVKLLKNIKSGNISYKNIPNLIYREGDNIIVNEPVCPANFTDIVPNFDDLPLDRYLTDGLPIQASRGCSWGKCTYCKHFRTYGRDYYEGNPEEIVNQIEFLQRKYGISLFHFVDDDMPYMLKNSIADKLLEKQIVIDWLAYSRFDKNITKTMLRKWYDSGLRVIEWGVESASPSVLKNVKKGTTITITQRLLWDAYTIGILNKVFMFHNLPSENYDDLWDSIKFLITFVVNGVVRPFWEILTPLELLVDTPLYNDSINHFTDKDKYFKKVFLPRGDLVAQAGYIPIHNYNIKKSLLREALTEVKNICKKQNILEVNDEAILFDIIIEKLRMQGKPLFVKVRLNSDDICSEIV